MPGVDGGHRAGYQLLFSSSTRTSADRCPCLPVSPRILVRCLRLRGRSPLGRPHAPARAREPACARRARVGRKPTGRASVGSFSNQAVFRAWQAVSLPLSAHPRFPETAPVRFPGSLQSPVPVSPDRADCRSLPGSRL